MIYLYILGFIISYILLKILRGKYPNSDSWRDVILTIFCSLFSWVAVLAVLLTFILVFALTPPSSENKPPKWM